MADFFILLNSYKEKYRMNLPDAYSGAKSVPEWHKVPRGSYKGDERKII